ncbi:Iron ABC transporter substrate-binding protein OS=Lysinibacillus sphaericus OX=1421 GN=LS41612_11175 PE=3 SV=1 [Lysinibacillus sphaericus]
MNKWKGMWLVVAIAIISILGACSAKDNSQSAAQSEHIEPAQSETTEVTIDNNGTTQVYTEAPKKAISLNQHVTEIMLALGLEDSMALGTAYIGVYQQFMNGFTSCLRKSTQYEYCRAVSAT